MSLFPELKTGEIYKQAPLPFLGQKKNFLKSFRLVKRLRKYEEL